jgi:hypothetical protein
MVVNAELKNTQLMERTYRTKPTLPLHRSEIQQASKTSGCRDSAVGISDWLRAGRQRVGVQVAMGLRIFSSPRRPDRLLGPASLLSNGYRG